MMNGIIPNFVKGNLSGSITVDGMDPTRTQVATMAQTVGLVFQDPNTQLFGMTVEEDIAFGATNLGYDYEESMKRVNRSVEDLNLAKLMSRKPMELSGGQKQSVAIVYMLTGVLGLAAVLLANTAKVLGIQPNAAAPTFVDAGQFPSWAQTQIASISSIFLPINSRASSFTKKYM